MLPTAGALARYGKIEKENGTYVGHSLNPTFDGFGVFTFHDSTIYAGMFKDGRYEGLGIYIFPEDYEGDYVQISGFFKADKRYGEGAQLLADNTRTAGQIENGQWVSGTTSRTVGEYESKQLQFAQGYYYVGEVRYGTQTPNGYGCLSTDGGALHLGLFANGVPDGPGIQMNADSKHSYFIGEWENGVLVSVSQCKGLSMDEVEAAVWPALASVASLAPEASGLDSSGTQASFFQSVANALMREASVRHYGQNMTDQFESDLLEHDSNSPYDGFEGHEDELFSALCGITLS